MSRAILVLGTGRCGSSAVAQVLHRLGCVMGAEFPPPKPLSDPHGVWEDAALSQLTEAIMHGEAKVEHYIGPLKERADLYGVWGFKYPRTVYFAHHIIRFLQEMGVEVRVIHTMRQPWACINSAMRAYHIGRHKAEEWYSDVSARAAARIMECDLGGIPVHRVWFDNLVADPERRVREIMAFAFEGLKQPGNRQLAAAIKCVATRPLVTPAGWGNIAVGIRMYKHPEPDFIISLLSLITGGLREGDTVLLPQKGQPNHWAADELARAFLERTQHDSILFLDDDHEFAPDALHLMRENQETWPYDAVMALIPRRNLLEPSPIIMRWLGPINTPQALLGEHYTLRPDFEEGTVQEVDVLGLGFTLFRRHVFEAMINEEHGLQFTNWFKWGIGREGEDVPFCQEMRRRGMRMAIDTNVQVGHITPVPIYYNMVREKMARSREEALQKAKDEAVAGVERQSHGMFPHR